MHFTSKQNIILRFLKGQTVGAGLLLELGLLRILGFLRFHAKPDPVSQTEIFEHLNFRPLLAILTPTQTTILVQMVSCGETLTNIENTFPEATLPEIINVVKEGMANYRILSQVGNQFLGDAYFSLPIAGSGGSTWSDWIILIAVTGAIVITVGTIAYYLWKRKGPTPPGESGVSLPQKAPVKSDQSIKASSLNTFSQISIILWILSLSLFFSLCSLTTLINYGYSS